MSHSEQRPPSAPRIAVVVPCYNEARKVAGVVAGIPPYIDLIIVVDDCSKDDTAEVLARLDDPRLVVLRHDHNQGVGAAMRTGYREALARGVDACVKMDGDGQMSPDDLPDLLEPVLSGRADYAKGNRFHDLEALDRMPRVRMIGNGGLSFLTKLVSGYWNIFDPTNGYTVLGAEALRRIDLSQLSDHYFFETSILVELNIKGMVVEDVPMPARYGDEQSSLRVSRVLFQFPPLLFRGLTRRIFWRYLIYDFNIATVCLLAGLPLFTFGVLFGGYRWIKSSITGIPATAGTTLLAALPIIVGVQLLLVAVVLDMLLQPGRLGARRTRHRLVAAEDPAQHPELPGVSVR